MKRSLKPKHDTFYTPSIQYITHPYHTYLQLLSVVLRHVICVHFTTSYSYILPYLPFQCLVATPAQAPYHSVSTLRSPYYESVTYNNNQYTHSQYTHNPIRQPPPPGLLISHHVSSVEEIIGDCWTGFRIEAIGTYLSHFRALGKRKEGGEEPCC